MEIVAFRVHLQSSEMGGYRTNEHGDPISYCRNVIVVPLAVQSQILKNF